MGNERNEVGALPTRLDRPLRLTSPCSQSCSHPFPNGYVDTYTTLRGRTFRHRQCPHDSNNNHNNQPFATSLARTTGHFEEHLTIVHSVLLPHFFVFFLKRRDDDGKLGKQKKTKTKRLHASNKSTHVVHYI